MITEALTLTLTAWNWGAKAAFFYAGTNLLCSIWCWFRLPETKDRTFGEIDMLFTHQVPARKFKSTHVDRRSLPVLLSWHRILTGRLEFAHGGDYLSKHETEHLESA
jgi:SP family general alpha glucoside:H+ symporter-like MFS transporter